MRWSSGSWGGGESGEVAAACSATAEKWSAVEL